MFQLHLFGPKDRSKLPSDALKLNATSTSSDFGKVFSPFMNQGPITIDGLTANNVENIWQGTKVYEGIEDFPKWRDRILADTKAHRYPNGRVKPICSRLPTMGDLDYISARKAIYIPAYIQKLNNYCQREVSSILDILTLSDLYVFDFDVSLERSDAQFKVLVEDPSASLGHGYILKRYILNRVEV